MERIRKRQDRSKPMLRTTRDIFVIARFLPSALSRLKLIHSMRRLLMEGPSSMQSNIALLSTADRRRQ